MRPHRSFSCDMRARRSLSPTIPIRRTLSVTKVTSLVFIFFMSDIPLIVFFAGARNWRSGRTATRCRCSPRKYDSGRTCSLVDPRSVLHLALKCSDIFEHVGLRTLLDDPALLQIAQDATDVLARHPGHGSQVPSADPARTPGRCRDLSLETAEARRPSAKTLRDGA